MTYSMSEIAVGIIATIISFIIFLISIKRRPDLKNILLVAFILRVVMAWVYSFCLDGDPDGYADMATDFTRLDFGSFIKSFQTGAYLYSWLVAAIWRVTGVNTILIRIINALLSYYCCILGYNLSERLFGDKKKSKKALLIIAIFPNLIRFSAAFASRETLFILLLMSSLLLLYNYYKNRRLKTAIGFFIVSIFGVFIHISIACLYILFFAVLMINLKKRNEILKVVVLAAIVVVGVVFMLRNNIGTEKLYLNKGGLSSDKIAWIQESSAEGRAAYLGGFSSNNPIITIIRLPVRMLYFMYSPFIWMVSQAIDLLGLLDGILYIWITFLILKSRKMFSKYENGKFAKAMLLSMVVIIAIMSIGTSNYGTALRHRAKIAIPLVCLAVPAITIKKEKR